MMRTLLAPVIGGGERIDLQDRVVVITGGAAGIGDELGRLLHRRGAYVALLDIDADAVRARAAALGVRAVGIAVDVADRAGVRAAIAQVREGFGRIDVVVANAGVVPRPATVRLLDPEEFDRVLAINLTGAFNTVQPALDDVIAAKGHVVVVSSCAAFAPGMGGSPYMVSKAGVEQLGRALRVELGGTGATAGIVYFGVVETAMTHGTLDEDELGADIGALLPWPLDQRITARQAAEVIAGAIENRSARAVAPVGWEPYALLRGVVNVALDHKLSVDKRVRTLTQRLEQRILADRAR
ncbi:SDR family NAD(P)-dependent oxidoreductase [Nocardia vermiculata]|uniref:SDR family NAD(P)-dependent oxidoreductase n=2 Tax=Nocardia vermiculata TaxID=257274 RepID=A0A846XQR1_9NOCA|nr:SDR family NAD(P)-dependent oxidoreductase [Nocardia vermiculata]